MTKKSSRPKTSGLRGLVELLAAGAALVTTESLGERLGTAEAAAKALLEELVERERLQHGESAATSLRERHERAWPFLRARPAAWAPKSESKDEPSKPTGFSNLGWPFSGKNP